jgi:hypothetical protein
MVDHSPVPRGSPSVVHQCQLLDISRSGLYYQPVGTSDEDFEFMKLIDRQYLATPFYGARKIAACLKSQQHTVNRKRVQRLMQKMGLTAIYRRPRTSKPAVGHKVYPYLLNGMAVTRPNQALGYRTPEEVYSDDRVESLSGGMIESLTSSTPRTPEPDLNLAPILSN